ncbi:alpha-1-inhibitor 3-like [Procambarus clarkii]|uniref:alpha-1-inhibitor 3-like n=1 Tax=Procambarus clarkii TaxID=6728 RepID=UPI003743D7F0
MAITSAVLLSVFGVIFLFTSCYGGYVITTPREWSTGETTRVCLFSMGTLPVGVINISLTSPRSLDEKQEIIIPETTLNFPAGQKASCSELHVPNTTLYEGKIAVTGQVGGSVVNHTGVISLKHTNPITFIQTDKAFYLPGQTVQFRILTIIGPYMHVSNEKYTLVWVTTPSDTRVAQWSEVDNTGGLVHLSFQLADDPEQGTYTIHVDSAQGKHLKTFDVKYYVLPRFEVKVTANKYVLVADRHFNFTVCARYTFGQPVKGSVRLEVNNARRKKCFVSIVKNGTISECREFVMSTSDLQLMDCQVYSVHAVARVTEEGTGVELTGEATLPVSRTQVTLTPVYQDKYMKPYLPFTLQVRAELPDKSPASGVAVEACAAGKCTVMVTPPDGLLTVVLPSYATKRLFMKTLDCRAGMNEGTYYIEMQHYYSPSNSSLLIYAPDNIMSCAPGRPRQNMVTLFYVTDQSTASITVQVVSRGQIQYWSTQEYELLEKDLPVKVEGLVEPLPSHPSTIVTGFVNLLIDLPLAASPNVMVVVWYTRRDGEVVSDARELRVAKCLGNPVTLAWTATDAQPGDTTTFTLSSEPNSLCSLGVVDKSTELLSTEATPMLDTLFNYAESFDISPWVNSQFKDYDYCKKHFDELSDIRSSTDKNSTRLTPSGELLYNYYTDYVDALKMFDDAGVYVFTNLTVETRPCEKEAWQPIGLSGSAFAEISRGSEARSSQTMERPEDLTLVRTRFPETMLWSLIMQPSSGVTKQEVKVPDTITEWVGKAVCVHPLKGVGLSPAASITATSPFFLDLTLPPSVKRGEILPVKISVFNYMARNLPIRVTLQESVEYKIVDEPGTSGAMGRRTSCVGAQEKVVHTVKLDFLALGEVNITVAAFVDHLSALQCGPGLDISRSDALIKPIKVEAEGFPKEKTWSKYLCSKEMNETMKSLEHWEISAPGVTVMGSERAWVTVVGDLLGSTLENLGSLIRMPYGCGEQNMINFAPNIYILQYLEASRQTMPEVHKKLITLMNTGYQRQLLYRRFDGSYSAFGNADPSGSTWLTAFVLKSFARARQYILVDGTSLNETSTWLKMKQNTSGCFSSVGMVNKAMKGGLNGIDSSVPLTAYVIISLLEAGNDPSSPEVSGAVKCLLNSTSNLDPYILARESYALALARHIEAPRILQMLMDQAVVQPNEIFWKLQDNPGESMGVAVETAGYAVLAMMTLNADGANIMSTKIVKWITAQRNGQGGFHSTQDTVVALQALAVYETLQHKGPPDVKTTVNATGFLYSFRINEANKLLQQLVNLPAPPINVSIGTEGQGCIVLQAVLRYNIPIPESGQAFSLTVETQTEPDVACVTKRITACTSYLLADGSSNMAVIEVKLVSGYVAEKADLEQLKLNKTVKRYEEAGNSISFYVAELTAAKTCVDFRVMREVDIEKAKPGIASVFDYYKPEFLLEKSYRFPPGAECRSLDS